MSDSKIIGHIKNRQNISSVIFMIIAVALNMLLSSFVTMLELPLYLDTVGTVIVAIMGGYFPGVIVGFTTNILKSIPDPSSLYYGVLNVLIALVAARFEKHGLLKKHLGVISMMVVLTLIRGGIGALIPWFMEGLAFDSESLSGILYATGLFGQGASHLLSSIIMDFPDMIITVLLALIVYRAVPFKYHYMFSFTSWMQNPVKEDEDSVWKRSHLRAISLRFKMLIVLVISLSIVAIVGTFISVHLYDKMMINERENIAIGTASLAAKVIDGDKVSEYVSGGESVPGYSETKELLSDILSSSTDISYLYVYQMESEGCRVVFDLDTDNTPADETGTLLKYEESLVPLIPSLLAGEDIDSVITNDKYGYLLTAMKPVYDSTGRCVCYAIADIDIEKLVKNERSFFTELITVFSSVLLVVCAFTIWMTDYHTIYPIKAMTRVVKNIIHSEDDQEIYDNDVREIRALNIHTGDEVEQLYQSICDLTLEQAEKMRSIRRLSDSTMKMQDGLIIMMADMVENRDSDTGAHIQKTAAYVKIIVEALKKKGYYAEKLTPKFMSDAVRSAPLHDVGKINIPDEVLNKPGKLNDKEYEIMKTHTTAGMRIMEHAINTVEGDSYLKEARNMAAYHHERWDGKGYPEGLHGEVIPLSARIMAVADVFDALTSPRVYKPAFPIEKAVAIIEEGKGTQFDPKCVEAFMDSLDEVKLILRKYNHEA